MRVFVTGATGFIGSHVVRELLDHGHQVLGLTRSDSGAAKLQALGVETYRGTIDDPDSLRRAVAETDGVIHTAFDHSNMADLPAAAVKDLAVVEALGEELAGTGKPFVTTYGVTGLIPGRLVVEDFRAERPQARAIVEAATLQLAQKDVRAISLRPSTSVHGPGDGGFVAFLVNVAREKGVSAYPGDGSNRWPAVHIQDAASLYRLALEKAPAGSVLHAVGDEGVTTEAIARAIGTGLGLPVEPVALDHFGWMGPLFALDTPASSQATQDLLGWRPTHPTLLEDLADGLYF